MSKAERIEYAIEKECQRFNLVEWCENWDITVEEFYRFLELGRRAFEDDEIWVKENNANNKTMS